MLPDQSIKELVDVVGLTIKDAKTLVSLDSGERLDYYDEVLDGLGCSVDSIRLALIDDASADKGHNYSAARLRKYGRTAANWLDSPSHPTLHLTDFYDRILHELGGLLSAAETPFSENHVSAKAMAAIVRFLLEGRITGTTAKAVLTMIFDGDSRDVDTIILEENLGFQSLPHKVYQEMAQKLIHENAELVQQIQSKGKHRKIQWLMGQMMRQGKGRMEASKAEAILKEMLGIGQSEITGKGKEMLASDGNGEKKDKRGKREGSD